MEKRNQERDGITRLSPVKTVQSTVQKETRRDETKIEKRPVTITEKRDKNQRNKNIKENRERE